MYGFVPLLFTCLLTLLLSQSVGTVWGQLQQLRNPRSVPEAPVLPAAPMVVIPEGGFAMGADGTAALEDERPQHTVWLDRFEMDRYEVTTGQYAEFLTILHHPPPWQWENVQLAQHRDRPVVGVSWFDADAYCRWRGKQLPTEAQWEKAARGTDGRLFPWGNQAPAEGLANFALGARFDYSQALMPVQHYEAGVSPYGIYQMAGNVGEWVADWYGSNYYDTGPHRNPPGPAVGSFRVLRGGSWSDLPKYLLTYGRFKLPPGTRNSYTGFRCAKTAAPSTPP